MHTANFVPPQVIFEDESLLVINKAPGTVVNRAQSVKEYTLQDWVEERYAGNDRWLADRASDQDFADRSGLAHRIDKDTSGVMIFGKTATAMHFLMEQFQERQVKKVYLALVHGHLPTPTGVVQAAIERNQKNRLKFTVSADGRPSETHFRVEEEFDQTVVPKIQQYLQDSGVLYPGAKQDLDLYKAGFSLVRLFPKTGRTHQIRVHMDYLHHPLVGDVRYVGRKRARLDLLWCHRQWLHASSVEVAHPETGHQMTFEAPLAEDLAQVLQLLRAE